MKYYTDGFMIGGNPSTIGGGYTIVDENNELIERKIIDKNPFTSNEAEILGILNSLKYAKEGDSVSTDSMCCLSWANKGYSKARPDLFDLLQECLKIKRDKKINLMWEAREFNLAGIYNEEIGGKYRKRDGGYREYKENLAFISSI